MSRSPFRRLLLLRIGVLLACLTAAAAGIAIAIGGKKARKQDPPPAVPVSQDYADLRQVGTLSHPSIRESSGIAASRRFPGVFWTHNDKGNATTLYAVSQEGKLLAQYPVAASDDDWEDIAADDDGNLYIANTGNNDADRATVEVHRFPEPDPSQKLSSRKALRPAKTWRLRFPKTPFDCESLFIHDNAGHLVSKIRNGGQAAIYRFPLTKDDQLVLEEVTKLPIHSPVTSADLSRDGRVLAVLSGKGLYLFRVNGDIRAAGTAAPEMIALPKRKLEAVTFTPAGLLLTAESREIYLAPHATPPSRQP